MIGDVLVSTIICNNLKKAFPDATVHYMVYASTVPVLQGNPSIDKLILFEDKHRKSKWQFAKLIWSIRKEKYDLIIDAYSKLESWITVFFSNAKRRISYAKKGRSFLYTDVVALLEDPKTNLGLTIDRRLSLLNPLNLNIQPDPFPKLYLTNEEKASVKKVLESHHVISSRRTVMLSIIGSSDIKTYPLEYMARVIGFIADNYNVNLLLNYIPSQRELAKTIYDLCSTSTQEKIYFDLLASSLREYIALMNECDMIIGNDGGAINIAKALNKPSFIIFSPWIAKKMWATFEDGKFHRSVHLNDYRPELFENKTERMLKKESLELYKHFKPDFFIEDLKYWLSYNLSSYKEKIQEDQQKRLPLTAAVITYNEEENVASLVSNLNFSEEVLIVDSFSTDGTKELMQKFLDVKFVQNEFKNFSDQRNFAINRSSNDWILFVDADERVTPALKDEISEILNGENGYNAYKIRRKFYFKGEPLRFGGFQTDKVVRLFKKGFAQYDPQKKVHEQLLVQGKVGLLKGYIDHYSFKNEEGYRAKMDHYAELRAQELAENGLKPNGYHFIVKPVYRFLYHYIIRFGFLDGKKGLFTELCTVSYMFLFKPLFTPILFLETFGFIPHSIKDLFIGLLYEFCIFITHNFNHLLFRG